MTGRGSASYYGGGEGAAPDGLSVGSKEVAAFVDLVIESSRLLEVCDSASARVCPDEGRGGGSPDVLRAAEERERERERKPKEKRKIEISVAELNPLSGVSIVL